MNSKTFEALNFCFQIQGLSRIFKFCTNPGKRSILLACDWGEISKQRRVTVAMHMHKTCTNTVPTSQAYRQNLSFKFWFTLIFNLFSTVWTYCSVAQVSCNICNAWLYVNYALMYFAYNNSSVNCLSIIVLRPDHHHCKYFKGRTIRKNFGHEYFSAYLSLDDIF